MSNETTIARLRADLAASQAHAKRLAKEVGEATERRGFFAELAATARAEYCELRASIGQPVEERGASTHADAVLQGQWLALGAKDRARVQRAQAFVARLKADGVVIPSTAPVRVLDGGDDSERDEPDGDAPCFVGAISPDEDGWKGVTVTPREAWDGDDNTFTRAITQLAGKAVIVREYIADRDEPNRRTRGIDRTAAGCATACTDQTDGYHGGDTELAADDVLDDPRMGGDQWITAKDVTQAMLDAWPGLWEMCPDVGSAPIFPAWKVSRTSGEWRPLRFPHQNVKTGAIESRYMTPEHFARCKWEWRSYAPNWKPRSDRPVDISKLSPASMWRPVGWPDVELSADELEANIDKRLLVPLDAGAKAAAEYRAAIKKYSPDMRDLAGRIAAVERRLSSLDALLPLVEDLGERLARLEGVGPEETPNPLLDGLVPVRADETHPGQWVTVPGDGDVGAWKRWASIPNPQHGLIELVNAARAMRHIKPDTIVYVEPE